MAVFALNLKSVYMFERLVESLISRWDVGISIGSRQKMFGFYFLLLPTINDVEVIRIHSQSQPEINLSHPSRESHQFKPNHKSHIKDPSLTITQRQSFHPLFAQLIIKLKAFGSMELTREKQIGILSLLYLSVRRKACQISHHHHIHRYHVVAGYINLPVWNCVPGPPPILITSCMFLLLALYKQINPIFTSDSRLLPYSHEEHEQWRRCIH